MRLMMRSVWMPSEAATRGSHISEKSFVASIGVKAGDKKGTQAAYEFTEELGEFFAGFSLLVNEIERFRAIFGKNTAR